MEPQTPDGDAVTSAGPLAARLWRLALLSLPLLVGLFLPGAVFLTLWWVFPLAAILGPGIWPGLERNRSALTALAVAAAIWVPTSIGNVDLVLPLCGTDTVGIVVPAAVGAAAYAVGAVMSVVLNRPRGWLLAGLAVPLTLLPTYYGLLGGGIAAPVTC